MFRIVIACCLALQLSASAVSQPPQHPGQSDQSYNRVDGYVFDKELEKRASEQNLRAGDGPIAELISRRVEDAERRMNTRIDAIVEGRISDKLREIASFQDRADAMEKRWTPVQNLVDRLNGLIFKLIIGVLLFGLLVVIVLGLLARAYAKVARAVNPLAAATQGLSVSDLVKLFQSK